MTETRSPIEQLVMGILHGADVTESVAAFEAEYMVLEREDHEFEMALIASRQREDADKIEDLTFQLEVGKLLG